MVENHGRIAVASVVVRTRRGGGPELQRASVCGHRELFVLFTGRRREVDEFEKRAAVVAGFVGSGAEAVSRSGDFYLWPRDLYSRRHHAAGADGERRGRGHVGVAIYATSDDANFGRWAGLRKLSVEESAEGAGAGGDSRRRREGRSRVAQCTWTTRAESGDVGFALRRSAIDRFADSAAGDSAYFRRAPVPRAGFAGDHALGRGSGTGRAGRRAGNV